MSEKRNAEPDLVNKLIDAYLSQYAISKTEIGQQIGFYKAHTRNFQLLSGAVFAAAGLVVAHPELQPRQTNILMWYVLVLFAVPITATYLFLDIMSPIYIINLIAERMVVLEDRLNKLLGPRVYVAETYASPVLHSSARPLPGVINPDAFLWAYGGFIYLGVTLLPSGWIFYEMRQDPSLSIGTHPLWWAAFGILVLLGSWIVTARVAWSLGKSRQGVRPFMKAIADPTADGKELPREKAEVSRN
jgi:hypothetical protein